jgi:hypothetical protein
MTGGIAAAHASRRARRGNDVAARAGYRAAAARDRDRRSGDLAGSPSIAVPIATLDQLDAEIAARLGAPVEYRLIDDEAALLVLAARRVTLARLDGDPAGCCVGPRSASSRARRLPLPIWRTQSRARGNRWSTTTICR